MAGKLAERFLDRVVVGKHLAPPVFTSFTQQLYKTGVLKVDCVVLQFERFDDAAVNQVLSTEKPPTVISVPASTHGGYLSLNG
jgi:hypothetical protein